MTWPTLLNGLAVSAFRSGVVPNPLREEFVNLRDEAPSPARYDTPASTAQGLYPRTHTRAPRTLFYLSKNAV